VAILIDLSALLLSSIGGRSRIIEGCPVAIRRSASSRPLSFRNRKMNYAFAFHI